jgi:hypothetical protein
MNEGPRSIFGWNELRLTKLALAIILLVMSVEGRRTSPWPIITWPMYSSSRKPVPAPTTFTVELRVVDEAGRMQKLTPTDIILRGRQEVAQRAMIEAFDPATPASLRDAHRRYLAGVVLRRLPDARTITVECWRTEWAVDPFNLPPLDRQDPIRSFAIGRFVVSSSDPTPREAP